MSAVVNAWRGQMRMFTGLLSEAEVLKLKHQHQEFLKRNRAGLVELCRDRKRTDLGKMVGETMAQWHARLLGLIAALP